MSYTAAVITISDKGARGERVDTSGPNLCEILKNKGFDIVPISELIHRGEFEMDHEGRQIPKT